MAKRATSSMPTQAESMKDPQVLNPMVRSYSLNEYDQKRPDYINPDHEAGKMWSNLSRSLEGFYGAFHKFSDEERDRYIERGVSLGITNMEHAVESEGAQANRKNWKKFVENHPEFANDNPWVEVGYNQARLRNLGMEMDTGLQTALENSGLYNKDDPEAVQAFINQYIQEFRAGAGIENMDAIQVAKHFSPTEAKIRQSATASYEKFRFSQKQTNLANEVHDGIVSALSNTKMSVEEQNEYIKDLVETAAANGLLNDKAEAVVPEAIKAAYAMSKSEKLLDRLEKMGINGRSLMSFKGVPEWVSAERTRIAQREAAEAQKAEVARRRYLSSLSSSGALAVAADVIEGRVGSLEEGVKAFVEKHGLPADAEIDLLTKAGTKIATIMRARQNEADLPANAVARDSEIHDITLGSTSYQEAYDKLIERFLKTNDKRYYEAARRVWTKGQTSGMTAEIAENKLVKKFYTELKSDSKALADDAVNTFKIAEEGSPTKSSFYTRFAAGELTIKLKNEFDSLVNKKIEILTEQNQGKPIGALQREQVFTEALTEIRDRVKSNPDSLGISKILSKNNLMLDIPNPAAERKDPNNIAYWDSQIANIRKDPTKTTEQKKSELQELYRKTRYEKFEHEYRSMESEERSDAKAAEKKAAKEEETRQVKAVEREIARQEKEAKEEKQRAEKAAKAVEKEAEADQKKTDAAYKKKLTDLSKIPEAISKDVVKQAKAANGGEDKSSKEKIRIQTKAVSAVIKEDFDKIVAEKKREAEAGNGGSPATSTQMSEIYEAAARMVEAKVQSKNDPYGIRHLLSRDKLMADAPASVGIDYNKAAKRISTSTSSVTKDEWDDVLKAAKVGFFARNFTSSYPEGATDADLYKILKDRGLRDTQIAKAYIEASNKRKAKGGK